MAQPEKIGLWDRLFNRYRKTVHNRGSETWFKRHPYLYNKISGSEYQREFVEYLIVDRVTGSERIEKEYLN